MYIIHLQEVVSDKWIYVNKGTFRDWRRPANRHVDSIRLRSYHVSLLPSTYTLLEMDPRFSGLHIVFVSMACLQGEHLSNPRLPTRSLVNVQDTQYSRWWNISSDITIKNWYSSWLACLVSGYVRSPVVFGRFFGLQSHLGHSETQSNWFWNFLCRFAGLRFIIKYSRVLLAFKDFRSVDGWQKNCITWQRLVMSDLASFVANFCVSLLAHAYW